MKNNTFEDYKKAIRAKYEIEKEGVYFNFLIPPSQANLRKLCWEVFKSNESKDDLSIFFSFFEFEFDIKKKNSFNEQTDRFRPIGSFLKGEKIPANRYAVELAAILVDYQPRPFRKFKERGIIMIEEPIGSPKIPFAFDINDDNDDDDDDDEEGEIEEEKLNYQEEQIANFNNEETFDNKEEKGFDIKALETKSINLFVNFKDNFLEKFKKKLKQTIIRVVIVFGLGFAISHYVFPTKQCMQWSNDHYEKVDCDLRSEGFVVSNVVEPFDEIKFGLKKIHVTDTTTCFNKNGDAVIWYAKTANGIDFFNTHGIHPENDNPLKPVTRYILQKYVK